MIAASMKPRYMNSRVPVWLPQRLRSTPRPQEHIREQNENHFSLLPRNLRRAFRGFSAASMAIR